MTTQDVQALGVDAVQAAAEAAAAALDFVGVVEVVAEWPAEGLSQVAAGFAGPESGLVFVAAPESVTTALVADQNLALAVLGGVLEALGIPTDDVTADPFGPSVDLPSRFAKVTAEDGSMIAVGVTVSQKPTGAHDFQPVAMQTTDAQIGGGTGSLARLSDVDMEVTVELGRTQLPIKELLGLQPGMVVEVDRTAGGPIDILVNGRLIARGEVVVIDDEFGVRVTDIVAVENHHNG